MPGDATDTAQRVDHHLRGDVRPALDGGGMQTASRSRRIIPEVQEWMQRAESPLRKSSIAAGAGARAGATDERTTVGMVAMGGADTAALKADTTTGARATA
ncbi:hypothetical protein E2562_022260 [Oryza meyeriana var. granulata]|uniref:Uncharacterized protein n=1 Tax=Oryza meyeriana var. granulata TaxID=110450 RepID=A0A6G1D640_9ORYZ|nr:hypothetical protein E2562_022260 [Oryza meyeriana var. granulata]